MAITAAKLQVEIDSETRGFVRGMDDADRRTRTFGDRLKSGLTTLAKWGAVAAAAGAAAAGAFAIKAVRAASDLNETLSKTTVVFGNATSKVTGFADEMADAFGLPKTEILDAASNIGLVAKASGVAEGAAADMSVEMAQLAADASSFYNVPLPDALEKIRSGLVGEAEPLRSFGVLLSAAAVETKAVEMGVAAAGEELTEQQKVMARAALITEGMSDASGDLARTQDSVANRMRALQGRIGNFTAEIGTRLLPVAEALLGWAADRMPAAMDTVASFVDNRLLPAFESFSGWWDDNGQSIIDMARRIGDTVSSAFAGIVSFLREIGSLAQAGEWQQLGETIASAVADAFDRLVELAGQLTAKVREMFGKVDWVGLGIELGKAAVPMIVGLAVGILNVDFGALLSGLAKNWQAVLIGVITIALAPAKLIGVVGKMLARIPFAGRFLRWGLEAVHGFGRAILRAIGEVFRAFGRGFMTAIGRTGPSVFARFRTVLMELPTWLRLWGEALVRGGLRAVERFGAFVGRHGPRQAMAALRRIREAIFGFLRGIGEWLVGHGRNLLGGFMRGVSSRIGEAANTMRTARDAVIRGVGNVGSALYHAGRDLLAGFIRGITSKVRDAVSAVQRAVGSVVSGAKRSLGIESPSTVFAEMAEQSIAGWVEGMRRQGDAAAMQTLNSLGVPEVRQTVSQTVVDGRARGGDTFVFHGIAVTKREVADAVAEMLRRREQAMR